MKQQHENSPIDEQQLMVDLKQKQIEFDSQLQHSRWFGKSRHDSLGQISNLNVKLFKDAIALSDEVRSHYKNLLSLHKSFGKLCRLVSPFKSHVAFKDDIILLNHNIESLNTITKEVHRYLLLLNRHIDTEIKKTEEFYTPFLPYDDDHINKFIQSYTRIDSEDLQIEKEAERIQSSITANLQQVVTSLKTKLTDCIFKLQQASAVTEGIKSQLCELTTLSVDIFNKVENVLDEAEDHNCTLQEMRNERIALTQQIEVMQRNRALNKVIDILKDQADLLQALWQEVEEFLQPLRFHIDAELDKFFQGESLLPMDVMAPYFPDDYARESENDDKRLLESDERESIFEQEMLAEETPNPFRFFSNSNISFSDSNSYASPKPS